MEYRDIPYVDKKVSRIFFGTAMEPFLSGGDGSGLLDAVYGLGVNAFDTARVYKGAEKVLGDWMEKRGNRDELVILSKCGHPTPDWKKRVNEREMRRDFEISSGYLHTDYIDIYLLHRDDPEVDAGEIVEIFNAMHAEGKIGAFGGSNWTCRRIEEANEYAYKHNLIPFTVSSPQFGLADQVDDPWGGGCISISGPSNGEEREWYRKTSMPVIAYSSLAHGFLSGKVKSDAPENVREIIGSEADRAYACEENFRRLKRCEEMAEKKGCTVAQIAMAWIYRQKLNTFAVVSASKEERMRDNIEALSIELGSEELEWLDLA